MTGSGLTQHLPSAHQDGAPCRFDTTLVEMSQVAVALSASPDPLTFHGIARDELGRMQARVGARSAHLVVTWGRRADQRVILHGPHGDADDHALVAALQRLSEWADLVPDGDAVSLDGASVPDVVRAAMAAHGAATMWVVGAARSMPGLSHAVFVFSEPPEPLRQVEAACASIHSSLLISRAITKLARFEWDELMSSWGGEQSSYVFAAGPTGMLHRWPFPIVGHDRRIEDQVADGERAAVVSVVDALLGGSDASYELVVHQVAGDPPQPLRLMMRRSPDGGIDGIVLPPDLPVLALPNALLERLTQREQEVVRLLADGLRVRQVGERLYLSQHTVRNHLKSIFAKLEVSSQAELIAMVTEPPTSRPG